jgi:hypothetical protein
MSELCQLMNFAGKSKVGNKAELQVTLPSLLVSVSDPDSLILDPDPAF